MSTQSWHRAYVRWYDHFYASPRHGIRAAIWGWIADRQANGA